MITFIGKFRHFGSRDSRPVYFVRTGLGGAHKQEERVMFSFFRYAMFTPTSPQRKRGYRRAPLVSVLGMEDRAKQVSLQ